MEKIFSQHSFKYLVWTPFGIRANISTIFFFKLTLRCKQSDIVPIIFHRCRWYRWCTLTCEYIREFSKKFETTLMLFSGAWKKMIHKKTWNKKSRDTVPLKQAAYNKTCWMMHWKRRGARPPWPLCWLAHAYTEYTQSSLNFRPWGPRLFSLRGRSVTEKSQFWPYHFLAIWWSAPTSHFSHWSLPWNEQPMGCQDLKQIPMRDKIHAIWRKLIWSVKTIECQQQLANCTGNCPDDVNTITQILQSFLLKNLKVNRAVP